MNLVPALLDQNRNRAGLRITGRTDEDWPEAGIPPARDLNSTAGRGRRSGLEAALAWCLQIAAALLCRGYLRLFHRLRIVGVENLPLGRSFVIVANHASHLDMFCLLAALPVGLRQQAFPVIAQDYFCRAWTRLAVWAINALPLDRRGTDGRSILECDRLLETRGNIVLLFPEGTRSAGGELAEFRPGVAFLAAGREIPVVPCHIAGTRAAWPKGRLCPRPAAVSLTIGTPCQYPDVPRTRQGRELLCQHLRAAVIQLGVPASPSVEHLRAA